MTFSELASAWKKTVLPMYKYSTRKHHSHVLRAKLLPLFGDRRVDKITRQEIQQYVAELISRGYAPKSIDHYHDVLSTILTKAVEWGYIQNNPAHGVELPRIAPICEKWVFTPTQAQELLSRLGPLPQTIIGLALLTGARHGELFALRWRSFDREKQALLIEEAIYDGVIDKPKTEKSIRRIPLSNAAIGLLESWRKAVGVKSPDSSSLLNVVAYPKIRSKSCGIMSSLRARLSRPAPSRLANVSKDICDLG
jgi:integrase